jgi:hypothetical protein
MNWSSSSSMSGRRSMADYLEEWEDFDQEKAAQEYLDRMDAVEPSLLLRRVADRYPEFEWLCWLPEEERHWYMTVGDQAYVRQLIFPHLSSWAYEALAS